MADPERLSVDYTLTRAQVWRWYSQLWLKSLWPIDLGLAFLAFVVVAELSSNIHTLSPTALGASAAAALLLLTLSPVIGVGEGVAWPTSLHASPSGIDAPVPRMTSGTQQTHVSWADITAIDDFEGGLALRGRSRSAFIIPRAAFASQAERDAFAQQARVWKAAFRA